MIQLKLFYIFFLNQVFLLTAFTHGAKLAGFKTEPTFTPEKFHIKTLTSNSSSLAPGYIFIDPLYKQWGYGPQIYTQRGELVWYGNSASFYRVQDFKVCDFLGQHSSHLCWHEAESRHGHYPVGHKVVFDNTYAQVGQNYSQAGNGSYPNTHEFRMVEAGEKFIQTVFEPRKMDLTPYSGPKNGWVFDGCFQEIETKSGNILFQWCYLQNGLPIWETRVFISGPGQTNVSSVKAGSGQFDFPWDFMHINAVDKNSEGDYLVSARFLDQILKIAGPDNIHGLSSGSIIWRLGGAANQFKKGFDFSKQHSVRYLETDSTGDTFVFLDNAWDGFTPASASKSTAKIVRVYNTTGNVSAILLGEFPAPEGKLTKAQGGVQPLANGNVLVGWGVVPAFSEFSPDGDLLYHVKFQRYSYRAFKFPWIGKPYWKPKILAYKKTCGRSPLNVYVSWNGATEVIRWSFHVSSNENGPWHPLGAFGKGSEFETHIRLLDADEVANLALGFPRYVMAEAQDAGYNVLGKTIGTTFVPSSSAKSKHKCDVLACKKPLSFGYDTKFSIAESTCGRSLFKTILSVLALILITELLEKLSSWFFRIVFPDNSMDTSNRPKGNGS